MMASDAISSAALYEEALSDYLQTHGEAALYRASLLSQQFIECGVGPEDIIALHVEGLQRAVAGFSYREQARAGADALQFLLEVMIAYGIQYRDQMESRLQQHTATQQAARERADLLAIVAHELGTPLTAARVWLDLSKRLLVHGELDRVPPLLTSAREALDRLTTLVNELMESSNSQQVQLDATPIEVWRIVQQACGWADVAAAEKGVMLVVEPFLQGVMVRGNTEALLKVFNNVLANAIRYTPAKGKVLVRQVVEGAWVWIEVHDSGIGMTEEVQARIFDKFFRGEDARKADAHGLGLGLTLVRRYVEQHEGRVEVTSAVGQGSTFRVALPIA